MIDQLVPIKRARGGRLRGAESKQRSDFARTLVVAAATYVQGDARPLVADDVVEVEDLALLRRWRVPTPACPSAPARRCRRWSSRIRATRCCRPCSRRRPRPLPLGGRLPAGALLRVRIEGQLRWKVGVRQADYEAGEECEIWMGNGSEQRVGGGEREGILGRNKSEMTYGS